MYCGARARELAEKLARIDGRWMNTDKRGLKTNDLSAFIRG